MTESPWIGPDEYSGQRLTQVLPHAFGWKIFSNVKSMNKQLLWHRANRARAWPSSVTLSPGYMPVRLLPVFGNVKYFAQESLEIENDSRLQGRLGLLGISRRLVRRPGVAALPLVVTFKDSSIETIATFVATGRKPSLSGETRGWTAYYSYMDPTGSAPVDSGNISASATTGTR